MTTVASDTCVSFVASPEHDEACIYAPDALLDAVTRMLAGRVIYEKGTTALDDGGVERYVTIPANGVITAYRLLAENGFPVELVQIPAGKCDCAEHVAERERAAR